MLPPLCNMHRNRIICSSKHSQEEHSIFAWLQSILKFYNFIFGCFLRSRIYHRQRGLCKFIGSLLFIITQSHVVLLYCNEKKFPPTSLFPFVFHLLSFVFCLLTFNFSLFSILTFNLYLLTFSIYFYYLCTKLIR